MAMPSASTAACSRASTSRTGKRKWKVGRYGHGQLVQFPDQDLLLALSVEGELALVGATPDKFTELARFAAIEGKTWNRPVLVGTSCWLATAWRWSRSGCPWRVADGWCRRGHSRVPPNSALHLTHHGKP
jgi:hypothetical protein